MGVRAGRLGQPNIPSGRHRRDEKRRQRERDERKRSRSKSQPKEAKRKRRKGPTDSDIERTYTGMDRELAEEFIEQTMDPAVLIDQTMSGTESEAWREKPGKGNVLLADLSSSRN